MATKYTPLQTGATPTLNTKGAGVAALQTQLNTQNAGLPGYVPLKVDSLYGPLTQAAAQYKAPVVAAPSPTIGSIYNIPTPQEDPNLAAARTAQDTFYQNQAKGISPVDENAIRANTLAEFQGEIDAVNAIYADKLREAKVAGMGRLGTSDAIQARRGLLGSSFGEQQTGEVNKGNQNVYNSIDNEKMNAIQSILSRGRIKADARIAEKTKAISEGLDAHLKYLSEAGARKKTGANEAALFIYNQKLSPKDLTTDQLAETAKNYGISVDDIKNAYTEVKKTGDATATKAAADLAKEKNQSLPPSAQEYEYAKANGYTGSYTQYQTEDANRKALALKAPSSKGTIVSGSATFTPDVLTNFGTQLEMSKGPDRYVNPQVYQQAYDAWVGVGGLAKDFLAKFPPGSYVNPANVELPSYLRNLKNTTGAGFQPLF